MSVTVQYKWLLSPKFAETVKKVSNFSGFPSIKESYNASRLVEQLEAELKKAQVEYLKIRAKHQSIFAGIKEKQASLEGGEQNGTKEKSSEETKAEADYQKEITTFLDFSVSFDKREPIKVEHIEKLALSPAELLCVQQVLDFSAYDGDEDKARAMASEIATELQAAPQP